ncbi:MAG: cobyric acid synthase [archaeon]|nr:cobyric acid synthase [archaeon]
MKCIRSRIEKAIERGDIHCNIRCEYHPCHFKGQNCSFCYCPFYPCNDVDLGKFIVSGNEHVWDCSQCLFVHRNDVVAYSFSKFKELGITKAEDRRIHDVLSDAKKRFFRTGKTLVVLDATPYIWKSITAVAMCRILARKGYLVSPFKSQNMILNSRVTMDGDEISAIQYLQSRACCLKNITSDINPILLKPNDDHTSQVIVEGKSFGNYDIESYYNNFIPSHGMKVIKKSIELLKKKYDYIIVDSEIFLTKMDANKNVINMCIAEMIDANCIITVNAEFGDPLVYVTNIINLIPEKYRKMIKGFIISNIREKIDNIKLNIKLLESVTGIPIIGVVPYIKNNFFNGDPEYFKNIDTQGTGTWKIAVIRLPKMSNFTDLDPLMLEDVTIKYIKDGGDLDNADAIIIPDTENTLADLDWMKEMGIFEIIKKKAGIIPIIGICGGYQMMSTKLYNFDGVENRGPSEYDGLALFDMEVALNAEKIIKRDFGKIRIGCHGAIEGYESHTAKILKNNEASLFCLQAITGKRDEGSVKESLKIFGTHLHGIFEKPSFRQYFISTINKNADLNVASKDFSDVENDNIDKIADEFEGAIDINKLMNILNGEE